MKTGTKVIVKGFIAGIVISSYRLFKTDEKPTIYRVLVDSDELSYRVYHSKDKNPDDNTDIEILSEDMDDLLYTTKNYGVLEVSRKDLKKWTLPTE